MGKRAWKNIVICTVLLIVIWGGFFLVRRMIRHTVKLKENDFDIIYQIDPVEITEEKLVLSGWIFKLGIDADKEDYEVLLYDVESKAVKLMKMKYCKREDVNNYFYSEYDYTDSGFIASIDMSKLDMMNTDYEILLRKDTMTTAMQTGVYLSKGKVVYVQPENFVEPNVAGTDLETIVADGVLRVYYAEAGVYIYQYKESLYWIFSEPGTYFATYGDHIQYQLDTNQYHRLPEHRKANNWNWDNLNFYFSDREWLEKNTGEYRVAVSELPREYSITKIYAGVHQDNNGWMWRCDFRPYYTKELLGE